MRESLERPPWWRTLVQLLGVFTLIGGALSLPLSRVWPRDFPDLTVYLATAAATAVLLTIAIYARSWRLAVGAAIVIPVLVAAAWHFVTIRSNSDLDAMVDAGDAASIALALHGRQRGWLWALGPATVTGSLAALVYALYCLYAFDRADKGRP